MFDDGTGKLNGSAATYALIAERDKGDFAELATVRPAGEDGRTIPLEPDDSVDDLPYLPDVLARGAAFRNLPGSGDKNARRRGSRWWCCRTGAIRDARRSEPTLRLGYNGQLRRKE